MKHLSLLSIIGLLFLVSGCTKDDCTRMVTYETFEPIYMQVDEFRTTVQWEDGRKLEHPGKIYIYNDYLLVNERRKGIHVFDNSNPAAPIKLGFINIPGNMDMAVRNGFLYADNATDLISIDLRSGVKQLEVVDREELAFPAIYEDPEKGYLIAFQRKEITEEVPCGKFIDRGIEGGSWMAQAEVLASNTQANNSGNNTGQGGSMARFSLMKDHLYVIDDRDMHTYATEDNGQLEFSSDVTVEWGIETLFGYEDYLFIGARNGMHIMDNTNPEQPVHLASYRHATACDPVFVSGDYAYVTLRDGTSCRNVTNQLDVVSISDIENPELLQSFEMDHPHGLSVHNNKLYLCEGQYGMKSFDASIPTAVGHELLMHRKGLDAFDVIVYQDQYMVVSGKDGMYQFSINSDSGQFQEISHIQVQ